MQHDLRIPAQDDPARSADWKGTARYEVLRCLGQGGMGVVYEALDRERQQRVALKTLLRFSPAALYRFKQEFRTLADVLHPNLVHLHELVATETDDVFFTMELVGGTDFLAYVREPKAGPQTGEPQSPTGQHPAPLELGPRALPMEPAPGPSPAAVERLRSALRQVVEGVLALHGAGKLHRDLKPSNVRVTAEGRAVILDFGVATELVRVADTSVDEDEQVVGSAHYMAPEQAMNELPAAASDWYSVGVMTYEALVGYPPFEGSTFEVLSQKNTVDPVPPSRRVTGVPEDLDALCCDLLGRDPEKRPTGPEILRRLGARSSDRAPAPSIVDSQTELVGREEHLRALREAFDATRRGRSITVRVGGASGMGKSYLVQHFVDGLVERSEAVVLRGRAYERESVPFKAVDSVIDALSRYLIQMEERAEALDLPADIWTLAYVFPVLRRVPTIDLAPQQSVVQPQRVRQRAFIVLRELLAEMTKRQPLVVFVDDAQWGDTDSAALLVELMRPPDAPGLLLLMTYRSEQEATSPFLAETRSRWPEGAELLDLPVGPLGKEEARQLAVALLGSDDDEARQTAEAVARESGGSPFLLEELARSASAHHRVGSVNGRSPAHAEITLDEVLGGRVGRLPDGPRHLLETIAVGGRPLPVATVAAAAGISEAAHEMIALLRTHRLVRAGLRDGREVVETSHDRIRQAIVGRLPEDVLRAHHVQLARVLEATPDASPEAIAMHLVGSGEKARAGRYAERAAEQAASKLAFDQAARLFQLTLDTLPAGSPDARRLQKRLAESLEWAGRGAEAARAYLDAASGAPLLDRVDLERAAAGQLFFSGRIDEGAQVCRRALAAVGMGAPRSPLTALLWLVVYRIWLRLLGLRFSARAAAQIPREDRVRLNALNTVARGLAAVDVLPGLAMKARYLIEALRVGDVAHVLRAAALEASAFTVKGRAEGKRERALFAISRSLAEGTDDAEGIGYYETTYGIGLFLRGRWNEALEVLDSAIAKLTFFRAGNANATLFGIYALCYRGQYREVRRRYARLLTDAEQRGDLYTAVNLRGSHPVLVWLADDDPATARRHTREAMAMWSRNNYLVQHWHGMFCDAQIELYSGNGQLAYERLKREAPLLKKSMLLSIQFNRTLTQFARGCSAVASLDGVAPTERRQRLAEARAEARRLEREGVPYAAALASIVEAAAANAGGDHRGAIASLRRAIARSDAAQMAMHAAAARHQLGLRLGDEEGRTLVREAEAAMAAQGVRAPARFAMFLVPGSWS